MNSFAVVFVVEGKELFNSSCIFILDFAIVFHIFDNQIHQFIFMFAYFSKAHCFIVVKAILHIEVIIIDDGSTDNARFLVSKYAIDYENVHLFRKENGGVSSARNYAMKYAKGEYIHFMDADDYLMFDSLEKLYNLAKEDDYDIVSGSFLRFNSKKTWISTISKYVYKNIDAPVKNIQLDDYPDLTWDMLIWNKIYKREFLEKKNG